MSFTEEQIAFRDNIRKMAARHVAPIAAEIDDLSLCLLVIRLSSNS